MAVLPTQINLILPRLLRTKFRSFSAFPPLNLLCDLKAALKSWFYFTSFSLTSDLRLTVVTKEIHSNIGQWLLLRKKKKKRPSIPRLAVLSTKCFLLPLNSQWARLRLPTDLTRRNKTESITLTMDSICTAVSLGTTMFFQHE